MNHIPSSPDMRPASASIAREGWLTVVYQWAGTKASWLVLIVSLLITIFSWNYANRNARLHAKNIFETRSADVVKDIRNRLQASELVLKSGEALFATSKNINREQWHNFVSNLNLNKHVGGILGVEYVAHIPAEKKESAIRQIRADGLPDFNIKPAGQRGEYAPLVYMESLGVPATSLLGFDLLTDAPRRAALEQARDEGETALSGKVRLILGGASEQESRGFLMFIPIFENGQPHRTLAERRLAIKGYVYIPFRTSQLMENLLGRTIPDLDIKIFDGNSMENSRLLYESISADAAQASRVPRYSLATSILTNGHQWTVYSASLPSFEQSITSRLPEFILSSGLTISLLLFFVVYNQEALRKKTLLQVGDMTMAFKASELKLKAILDQSPIVFWTLDSQLKITLINGSWLRVFKRSPESMIGKNIVEFFGDKDPSSLLNQTLQEALLGKEAGLEIELQGAWFQNSIKPLKNEQGEIVGVVGVSFDITARKNAKKSLERMGRLYRLLSLVNESIVRTQNKSDLFKEICNASVDSGLFLFAWVGELNKLDASVAPVAHSGTDFGYLKYLNINLNDQSGTGPTGNALRNNIHYITQDIENDPIMSKWREAALKRGFRAAGVFPIREGENLAGVITVYAEEASFFTTDIIKVMLELAADTSFALEAFADRQQREKAEIELKKLNLELEQRVKVRTHQLEVINNELESFSYSVSHDLRAPLRSIDGFSQMLLKKYLSELDETGRDYLHRIRRASQRMGQLIDDLIQLSRVTRNTFKREHVDLSKCAENSAEELRKLDPERHVVFTLQHGLSVFGDPGLLYIVMDNLLGNAYKFTGKKAQAHIEFGMINLDGEDTFFVRDNGDGFDMAYAHKLFGAFQRLHALSEFEGTGIGLATVRRIIHGHNGKVWAEAKEGEGAVFYFTLPQKVQLTTTEQLAEL